MYILISIGVLLLRLKRGSNRWILDYDVILMSFALSQ